MKKNQVFCRAYDEAGKMGTADVLDLDEPSFRCFVLGLLCRSGLCTSIRDEYVEGEHIPLRLKPGIRHKEDDDS